MNQKIKISQLPAKGSNLAAADLLEIAEFTGTGYISKSITGAEIAAGATAGFVPETRTLTINGTTQDLSADRTFTISTGITIGTTAITSGTVGRVLFEGTGNVVQESANLFWNNTNGRLGIGTSTPLQPLHVTGRVQLDENIILGSGGATNNQININATGSLAGIYSPSYNSGPTSIIQFKDWAGVEGMRLTATRNLLINTTTDAGFRLDVNGTARVSNNGVVNVATFTGSDGSTIIDRYGNFYSQGLNATSGINGTGVVGLRINKTDGNGKDWRFEQSRNLTDGSLELGVSPWTNNIMTLRSTGVIGINTNAPNASAQLEVASTTRGFLCPRMTTTQKNAIASPAAGLMVFDSTLGTMSVYNGTIWISL